MGKKFQKILVILMVLSMVLGTIPVFATIAPVPTTIPLALTKTVTPVDGKDNCLLYDVELAVTGDMPEGAKETYDIMLVLDVSGSMVQDNKLTNLKAAAQSFIGQIAGYNPNSKIGIVAYSNGATLVSGLLQLNGMHGSDTNAAYLSSLIGALTTQNMTNIESGIIAGYAALDGTTNKEIMLVMSDGVANWGSPNPPAAAIAAATVAKNGGVTIYSVGMSISDNDVKDTMKSIASAPSSSYYFDCNSTSIIPVFNQIATELTLNLTVTDTVGPDFTAGTPSDAIGSESITSNVLTWTFTKAQYVTGMKLTFRVTAAQHIVTAPVTLIKTTNSYSANTNVGAAKLSYTVGSVTTDILSNTPADVTIPGFSLTAGASATNVLVGSSVNLTATPSALTGRCENETITYSWTQDGVALPFSTVQNPTGFVVTANTTLRVTATTSAGHVASAIVKLTTYTQVSSTVTSSQVSSTVTSSGKPLTTSDPGAVTSTVSVASVASIAASSVPLTVISTAASSEEVVVISEESVPLASPETGAAGSAALYAAMTLLTSGVALTIFSKKNKNK